MSDEETTRIRRVYDTILLYGDRDEWTDANGVKASEARAKGLDILVRAFYETMMLIPSIQNRSVSENKLAQFYTDEVASALKKSRKKDDASWYILGKPKFVKETPEFASMNLENTMVHRNLVKDMLSKQPAPTKETDKATREMYEYNKTLLKYFEDDVEYIKANKKTLKRWRTRTGANGALYWENSKNSKHITFDMPFRLKNAPWKQKYNAKSGTVYWFNPKTKTRASRMPKEVSNVFQKRRESRKLATRNEIPIPIPNPK